jgi:hypothetical protein
MLIHEGTQERLITETTTGAGTTAKEGSIASDTLLVSLWVDYVSSGDLTVQVYTLTSEGKQVQTITFPVLATGTTELLLKKSAISLQRFKVVVTYTGVCSYEIYTRAISAGETNAKILGNATWSVNKATIGVTPQLLIPGALADRRGLVIRNNSSSNQIVYVGESAAAATIANGFPIIPGESFAVDLESGAAVYAVSDLAGADVRYAQAGG